jgi:hypothetical protein
MCSVTKNKLLEKNAINVKYYYAQANDSAGGGVRFLPVSTPVR